jgi:hypothetical protein
MPRLTPPNENRRAAAVRPAAALLAAALVVTPGCIVSRPIGPPALQPAYLGFNEAIAAANDRQLLLNLVRLRYRDTPLFLEVGSVVSQHTRSVSGALGAEILVPGEDNIMPGVAGSLSESPVVTLAPLKGAMYARRLMEALDHRTVIGLAYAGWSLERLMVCCVQQIGTHLNAPTAAGPTPALPPLWGDFQRAAVLLRELQLRQAVRLSLDEDGRIYAQPEASVEPELAAKARELGELLGLQRGLKRLAFGPPRVDPPPGHITLMPRSLMGALYFLSQGVEAPEEHERAGIVTVTREPGGERFDWNRVLMGTFRVRSGREAPATATLRVPHRGYWFWIDDADLESKTTFSLVSLLFALQSGEGQAPVPMLAIGK